MPSLKIKTPVIPGGYYHIFNRGNNNERVFYRKEDYLFFLKSYKKYLEPYVSTYSYCLIPNHYHFLVQINPTVKSDSNASNEFRKLFLSYTHYINSRTGRTGNLFDRYFKRLEISEMDYLKRLVYYIHLNPVKHGLTDKFAEYPYSSYQALLSSKPTSLLRDELFSWYGSRKDFIEYHSDLNNLLGNDASLVLE